MDFNIKENNYLISMTPYNSIIEAGYVIGLNSNSNVLDLCCGYGEMLKIWNEQFGIRGVGVDVCEEFILTGTQRLADNSDIELVQGDVLQYHTDKKFDVVSMCGIGDLFGGIEENIAILEKYVKPNGKLVIAECLLKNDNAPQALIDFEGNLYTLDEINNIFNRRGYYITYFSTGTNTEWEHYIAWDARRTIQKIQENPNDAASRVWLNKWYQIYFKYRRNYEGWGFFVIEHI